LAGLANQELQDLSKESKPKIFHWWNPAKRNSLCLRREAVYLGCCFSFFW